MNPEEIAQGEEVVTTQIPVMTMGEFARSVKWFLLAWVVLLVLTLSVTGLSFRALAGAFFSWCGGIVSGEVIARYPQRRKNRA